jgi:3-phosphoshikimate 1-carboxyvinyltransferase
VKITRATSLRGTIDLPGDKSISHRAAILAAMAVGETRIENFSAAEDCSTTLRCLDQLGVSVKQNGTRVFIIGVGKNGFHKPDQPLHCGNSGTTMRMLCGVLAVQNFEATLVGDESLQTRPMQRVVQPLEKMGARIETESGRAPIRIFGTNSLHGIDHIQDVPSAQIKSSILLAGLNAEGETAVIEKVPTRDHTERMLEWFGAQVKTERRDDRTRISVSGDSVLAARDITVPADISSAAFFIAAAACLHGSEITLRRVGINPTRTAFLDLLYRLGAKLEMLDETVVCNEPVGTIRVRSGFDMQAERVLLDGAEIAGLIDELPVIAVLGTQLNNGIEVRDAGELRVKETDRIHAVVENLRRMDAVVEEFPDGFRVERSDLKGSVVESFGDHRIAMAFAVAGLLADGETEILGSECVNVSFPRFFETLGSIGR